MPIRTAFALSLLCAVVGYAQDKASWQIGPFTRPPSRNPIIAARPESSFLDPILKKPIAWEALHTFNPAAVVRDGKVYVLYRAEDNSGTAKIGGHTSRLGLAVSEDGIHFTRRGDPVFYPAADEQQSREWPGGVEDPRIVETEKGSYVLTYTQWNQRTYTVGVATSPDLVHWTKHGPAFAQAGQGKYTKLQYKSAAILTRLDHERLLAAKIHGKYWM